MFFYAVHDWLVDWTCSRKLDETRNAVYYTYIVCTQERRIDEEKNEREKKNKKIRAAIGGR